MVKSYIFFIGGIKNNQLLQMEPFPSIIVPVLNKEQESVWVTETPSSFLPNPEDYHNPNIIEHRYHNRGVLRSSSFNLHIYALDEIDPSYVTTIATVISTILQEFCTRSPVPAIKDKSQ